MHLYVLNSGKFFGEGRREVLEITGKGGDSQNQCFTIVTTSVAILNFIPNAIQCVCVCVSVCTCEYAYVCLCAHIIIIYLNGYPDGLFMVKLYSLYNMY